MWLVKLRVMRHAKTTSGVQPLHWQLWQVARAACTDLLSEQFGLEWVKKPWVSSVNKKEMIRAEQAHFCWDSLKAIHAYLKCMERNITSGGRHGDKLSRQCCSSRWERTALDHQKNWIIGCPFCVHPASSSPAAVGIALYHSGGSQSWVQFWSSYRDLSLFLALLSRSPLLAIYPHDINFIAFVNAPWE